MKNENIESLFSDIIERRILKKAVFSKPDDKQIIKSTVTPYKKPDGTIMLRLERFTRDNKAYQQNLEYEPSKLASLALTEYKQTNIFTTAGDIEIRRSKSGSTHVSGKLNDKSESANITAHNGEKHYILDLSRDIGFLHELGLADKNGRIHDKKQAKFRQINRFLEIVRDIEDTLPSNRPIVIYDLCCGKSYLTFAVYYYFTYIKERTVHMYGVDLKQDVIEYCNEAAKRQGFKNLQFVSGNINEYDPPEAPDMIISLHACDIATDIVLYNAIRWKARVILSTPCCHHEMSKQLSIPAPDAQMRRDLDFILSSPILKQKLCDSATDALRVKRLESRGYSVTTLELIDPDETPKNLMIRAILTDTNTHRCGEALAEYKRICASLGVSPYLDKLLNENEEKLK
ncbi:MAG: SAM-dependent methyltransferase [Clostridiales bacterium]|nr:SAM-dependent methyltransferase [Clostridiales bacterium]